MSRLIYNRGVDGISEKNIYVCTLLNVLCFPYGMDMPKQTVDTDQFDQGLPCFPFR